MFKKKCIAHFSKKGRKAYVFIGGDFVIRFIWFSDEYNNGTLLYNCKIRDSDNQIINIYVKRSIDLYGCSRATSAVKHLNQVIYAADFFFNNL